LGPLINLRNSNVSFFPGSSKYFVASGNASLAYIYSDKLKNIINLNLGQIYQSHGINSEETLIAVATEDGGVTFWNLDNGNKVGETLMHDYEVEGVVFHPQDDRYVFTFMDGGSLYGWNREEGNVFMGPVKLSSGRGLYINRDGTILTALGLNDRVYRVPIQIPQNSFDYSTWLPELANSLVGFRMNDSGGYEILNRQGSLKLKKEAKTAVANGTMANWLAWLTDESFASKAAPFGDATREQIVSDLVNTGTLFDLLKALELNPSDSELLSDFALKKLVINGVNEKSKRFGTFAIAQARELGGDNAVVLFRSAQIEKMLNNRANSLNYIDRAIELDPLNTDYSEFKKALLQND
jgi:hypothetical protein